MRMMPYAELQQRRRQQILTDAAVGAGIVLAVVIAILVNGRIAALGNPGAAAASSAEQMITYLGSAASTAHRLPLVGTSLSNSISSARDAAVSLRSAALDEQHAAGLIAITLALLIGVGIPAYLLLRYLPQRMRLARDAAATAALRDSGQLQLLALRALTGPRPDQLDALNGPHNEPTAAYQAGQYHELAALECRRHGLRPPRDRAGQ